MSVIVQGRTAFAEMLRLLAAQVDDGSIDHPFSIQPAPHLGPFVVRIGGIDYDLSGGLPGVLPDTSDTDETPTTAPGKSLK